jgi:predicted nucleic acid-binding protein
MLTWTPGVGFDDRLLQLAVDHRVYGPSIFDLQIALTAFEHGAAELWTHDRHFVTLPGLRLVHPL